jgi:hypothetical protein
MSNADNYIHACQLPTAAVHRLKQILRQARIRRTYREALVYTPVEGAYSRSASRMSKKATFYNTDVVDLVQKYMPDSIFIRKASHVDLVHYRTGDYFDEHTDYVNTFPDHACQVTILIGLLDAKAGGTGIRTNGSMRMYSESRQRGGMLIFNSHLPHLGERVIGEKEIVVLSGFLFSQRVPKADYPLEYCDYMQCLAVSTQTRDLGYSDGNDDGDADTDADDCPLPATIYIYSENRLRAAYNTQTGKCYAYAGRPTTGVTDFAAEQLYVMTTRPHESDFESAYPCLAAVLKRKKFAHILSQASCSNSQRHTTYTYETEMCNGGDDYDVSRIPDLLIKTSCRSFEIAMYNKKYYMYWLRRIYGFPVAVCEGICAYVRV